MVDMVTIGAGGGSIAKVEAGTLTVGPQSAGADPGPAAYGRGGERADRHRRACRAGPPAGQAAGRPHGARRRRRASRAIDREVAEPLEPRPRRGGARRAVDPRPQHGGRACASCRSSAATIRATSPWCRSAARGRCMAARSPSCSASRSVLIPPAPGVLCADGLLAADLKAEFSRTLPKAGAVDVAAGAGDLSPSSRLRPTTGSPMRRSRRPTASSGAWRCCATTARAARSRSRGSMTPRTVETAFGNAHQGALRLHARLGRRARDPARRGDRPHAAAAQAATGCWPGRRRPDRSGRLPGQGPAERLLDVLHSMLVVAHESHQTLFAAAVVGVYDSLVHRVDGPTRDRLCRDLENSTALLDAIPASPALDRARQAAGVWPPARQPHPLGGFSAASRRPALDRADVW